MKIAVSSSGTTLDAMVDARFGRCPYYLCIDSDTLAVDAITNPNASLAGGAGPQSASLMADKGVSVVLTGNCGPNAFQAFGAAGIQVITGISGRVRDVVEEYKTGRLAQSSAPSVQSHYGTGNIDPGRGRGKGGGGGRGMGGGGGKGMGGGGRGLKGAQ
jgi:predicted Fe-Mo cluster-binding NifX family protein